MRRCAKIIVRAILILGIAPCATAQNVDQQDQGGWVISGYLGGAHTAASDLTISQPTLGNNLTFEGVRFSLGRSTRRCITAFVADIFRTGCRFSGSRRSSFT